MLKLLRKVGKSLIAGQYKVTVKSIENKKVCFTVEELPDDEIVNFSTKDKNVNLGQGYTPSNKLNIKNPPKNGSGVVFQGYQPGKQKNSIKNPPESE